jgi:hypothetical protein
MQWFRVTEGRLRYRGRITREPFTAWTATTDGAAAVTNAASSFRIPLFAHARARRQLWRALSRDTSAEPLRATLQAEADRFVSVMAAASYAASLPRTQVSLRRLVVVPRTMIVARARSVLAEGLQRARALATLDENVRVFFFDRVLKEMGRAVQHAKPSPQKPVAAGDEWACVGLDPGFVWVDPLWSGQDWCGHVFMYEMPKNGLSRRERRELETAIERIKAGLPSLSRAQRDGLVRTA